MLESSLNVVTSATMDMIKTHYKLREVIENSKSQDKPKKYIAFLSASVRGRWFNENYLSRKREIGLKNALTNLWKSKLLENDNAMLASRLEINLFKKVSSSKEITGNKHYMTLEDVIPDLLRALADSFPEREKSLSALAMRLEREIKTTHDMKEAVIDTEQAEKSNDDPNKDIAGLQAKAVENIVAKTLATLDTKVAHKIRTLISRSDNKLKTLELELGKLQQS